MDSSIKNLPIKVNKKDELPTNIFDPNELIIIEFTYSFKIILPLNQGLEFLQMLWNSWECDSGSIENTKYLHPFSKETRVTPLALQKFNEKRMELFLAKGSGEKDG